MSYISYGLFANSIYDKMAAVNPTRIGLASLYHKLGLRGRELKGAVLNAERQVFNGVGDALLNADVHRNYKVPVIGAYLDHRVKNYLNVYGQGRTSAADKILDELTPYAKYLNENYGLGKLTERGIVSPVTAHFSLYTPEAAARDFRLYTF